MAVDRLEENEVNYRSNLVPTGSETANSIVGNNRDNTIIGNQYNDTIIGSGGDDTLIGGGGDDTLIGNEGNDRVEGRTGNDILSTGEGNDHLYGGVGVDTMYGGAGDDTYYYRTSENSRGEFDRINDDKSNAGQPGYGGGNDTLIFQDVEGADLRLFRIGNDMYVTDVTDIADRSIDEGVIIENFFLGGNNLVEQIAGSDGIGYVFSPPAET